MRYSVSTMPKDCNLYMDEAERENAEYRQWQERDFWERLPYRVMVALFVVALVVRAC